MKPKISIEELRELVRYDPETGKLYWLPGVPNNSYAGKEAFTAVSDGGRRVGMVRGRMYKAHQVCWALHYGVWPAGIVDHKDRDRGNNRIGNLREATIGQNNANGTGVRKGGYSAFVGVTWCKRSRKWTSQVYHENKGHNCGRFGCESAAAIYRDIKAFKLHGEFALLNFRRPSC